MKYTIEHILSGEDELILKYQQQTPEIDSIISFINGKQQKLSGKTERGTVLFQVDELLYIEKVDDKTFAYTMNEVIQLDKSLQALEIILNDEKYFRCSKSMIVNINQIQSLRSLPSNRIDAAMCNGEHIIISRKYAAEFRRILKGES